MPREPETEVVHGVSLVVGTLSAFVLTLLFPDVLLGFDVDEVPALSADAPLDVTACNVGVVAK